MDPLTSGWRKGLRYLPNDPARPTTKSTRRSAKLRALAVYYQKNVVFDRSSPVDEIICEKGCDGETRKEEWWMVTEESQVGSNRKGSR